MSSIKKQVSFLYRVNFSCLMIYYISVPYGTIQCMLLGCHYTGTDVHKLLQASHNIFVVELFILLSSGRIYVFFSLRLPVLLPTSHTSVTLAYFM
jgi:hypothetical protein